MYCHLHVHGEYSLLDGSIRTDKLVERAKELGMEAIALTDHGSMYGVIHFYKACKKAGIRPIIGCEVYVAPRSRFQKEPGLDDYQYHLVLLAQNKKGYENLSNLVSRAYIEGFYYKPRIDKKLLEEYSEGLIVLSGCLGGEVAQLLLNNKYKEAKDVAKWFKKIFKDKYFLEIQDHGLVEQKHINPQLVRLSRELDIPLVATNDVHYLTKEDAKVHDILLCIQTGKKVNDIDRMRFDSEEFYLKSEEEMREVFRSIPEAVENTKKIADMVDLEFEFNQMLIPPFKLPEGFNSAKDYLRHLCYEGLNKRYKEITQDKIDRLEYELEVIDEMGFNNYFLIVWDFVNFAKRNGILVGPGRGSAAGSLVSYVLEITNLDPLPYDLLFERFLNPERISMPDIDIDFCYERRNEVIQYVREKYGKENVAQICTFGTMAARMAIRDVGRALNISYNTVDRIAKMIPQGLSIKEAIEYNPDLQEAYRENKELLDIAMALEGLPRHSSTHAAGVVISQEKLIKHTPLQMMDGVVTTQYDMEVLEDIGLLKMDFLGLRTLTMMKNTVEQTGENIDIDNLPLDDEKTYELLSRGDTAGVFQLESSGMRAVLRELKPTKFEDIIAIVALYRPGPMEQIPVFIENKHGKPIEYLHTDLEPILKTTYGVIVYQEQIMQIAHKMAGYSLGKADVLRKAIGKKKKDQIDAQREGFIEGVEKTYGDRKLGEKLFDLIEKFAQYGFNKSHAAAYALVAYQTAYLKAHYPVEFMAALLTSEIGNTDKIAEYIQQCNHMGIKVLPPDINESDRNFTVVSKDTIRFGLAAIKNVGDEPIRQIVESRRGARFSSLHDFCSRVNLTACNRRVVESLIKAGAFDSLGGKRSQYLNIMDKAFKYGQSVQKEKESDQLSLLFQLPQLMEEPEDDLLPIEEFPFKDLLQLEKEMLGLYISGHPLDEYKKLIKEIKPQLIEEIKEELPQKTKIVGYITSIKRIVTKNGDPMCFLKIEDYGNEIDVVVFPNVYERCRFFLEEDVVVVISGKVQADSEVKIIANYITPLTENPKAVIIELPKMNKQELKSIGNMLSVIRGHNPVFFYFEKEDKMVIADHKYWIDITKKANIARVLGEDTVKEVRL